MQAAKADPSLLQSARKTEVGERFNRTLFAALDALEEAKVESALIGGVATSGLGRPRATHDIDIFVRPEDAGAALDALAKHGFTTEKTDTVWLFKAWKEEILVDIIFKSRGDIYFDSEMNKRAQKIEYHDRHVRMVAPEDLVIIKCVVHDEIGPHHWHDALAILSHANIDWDYLLKRARRAPRRLLALLLYAQSNDIWVPNRVITDLYRTIFSDSTEGSSLKAIPGGRTERRMSTPQRSEHSSPPPSRQHHDPYLAARIKDALARDTRTGEQEIKVMVNDGLVILRGEVNTAEHRKLTEDVVRECAPGYQIDNQIKVPDLPPPEQSEEVR